MSSNKGGNQMSSADASRIQSTQVRHFQCHNHTQGRRLLTISKAQGGKDMSSGGFAARAQSAAATNANNTGQQGGQGQASSGKK